VTERALVGSRKGDLRLYDLERKEMLLELKGHRLSIESIAITPDGRRAVSGGHDKSVKLWNLVTGELIDSLYPPHEGVVHAVAISPDGAFAVRRLEIVC
jgi:WD40 repeat protein